MLRCHALKEPFFSVVDDADIRNMDKIYAFLFHCLT